MMETRADRRLVSSGSPFETAYGYSRALRSGDEVHVSGTTGYDYAKMAMPEDVAEDPQHLHDARPRFERSRRRARRHREAAHVRHRRRVLRTDLPAFQGNSHAHFYNLHGSQKSESIARKIGAIVGLYARLVRYALTAKPKIFHILWNNKLPVFDRTLLMLVYKLAQRESP